MKALNEVIEEFGGDVKYNDDCSYEVIDFMMTYRASVALGRHAIVWVRAPI